MVFRPGAETVHRGALWVAYLRGADRWARGTMVGHGRAPFGLGVAGRKSVYSRCLRSQRRKQLVVQFPASGNPKKFRISRTTSASLLMYT
jgi:hypothetical protein